MSDIEGVKVDCRRCGRPISTPGALAFSPPPLHGDIVTKYHVCVLCWPDMLRWLDGLSTLTAEQWFDLGQGKGYVGEGFCAMHDMPLTEEEAVLWEAGEDRCIPAVRINLD